MEHYNVIGLMSGTSLDGVDIAYCEFIYDGKWQFNIPFAETISYSNHWKHSLNALMKSTAVDFAAAHSNLGIYFGDCINDFVEKHNLHPDFISAHGHTIFHQPSHGFTSQIGSGAHIAACTGLDVICDFRSKDVAMGGQGAPLVPAGDINLFKDYRFCLNLGGIANVTVNDINNISAFDICPVNIPLNELAAAKGRAYDADGKLASSGNVDDYLLQTLNELNYYALPTPKSIGREWYEKEFAPLLELKLSIEDKLATVCQHIGIQIGTALSRYSTEMNDQLLVTGGGAFNPVVINAIRKHSKIQLVIPEKKIIEFKEALIFAFLGVRYMRNEINVLSGVTGSRQDHIGGALYKGN